MGAFARGDIVLFPFPHTDLSNRKLRPCLVISEEMGKDIVLCQITSKKVSSDEYSIEIKNSETKEGSLMIDSYVRVNMLFTASKGQIHRKICKILPRKYDEVVNGIMRMISRR